MRSNEPQTISKTAWYYEEPKCIEIVHETRDDEGNFIKCEHIRIPYRKLRKTLARADVQP